MIRKISQKYYNSIDVLPLYNFDKYRNTKDLNWFIQGFDGRQTKIHTLELEMCEKTILDEYFKAIDDRSFSSRLQKLTQIEDLKLKYNVVKMLINRMWLGFADSQMEMRLIFIQQLAKHGRGFSIPEINSKDGDAEELVKVNNAAEGIKTRIHLLENELKKDEVKESSSLAKQLQIATIGLQYPYRLNPKEITVSEWIEICKLLEEKAKQN
jgi:hypothetical protein